MKKKICFKNPVLLFLIFCLCLSALYLSCRKKNPAVENEEQQLEENTEAEAEGFDFYNPADDDASWVDSLFVQLEEERLAQELAQMENTYADLLPAGDEVEIQENEIQEDEAEQAEEINPIEKFFEEAGQGKTIRDKKDQLRFYEFQNEVFSPQATDDGYIVVQAADGNVIRNYYNLKFQLEKKEEWSIKSASDAKLLKTEEFIYSEEKGELIQKNITKESDYETISYRASFPLDSKKYATKDGKKYIIEERNWTYDSNNQLLKDEQKEYKYSKNDYSSKPDIFARRYEYTYYDIVSENEKGENEIPPDLKYFENNILKMQYNYTAQKGAWYSWVYFDENFSVKTYYEDDIKVIEEFYNKGNLVRKKQYEKAEK